MKPRTARCVFGARRNQIVQGFDPACRRCTGSGRLFQSLGPAAAKLGQLTNVNTSLHANITNANIYRPKRRNLHGTDVLSSSFKGYRKTDTKQP